MSSPRPLSVDADLEVSVDGAPVDVWSDSGLVVVDVPTFAAARAILGSARALPAGLDRLGEGLEDADLDVEVRVRYATVARAGPGTTPGSLARLAGVPGSLDIRGVATALVRGLF